MNERGPSVQFNADFPVPTAVLVANPIQQQPGTPSSTSPPTRK